MSSISQNTIRTARKQSVRRHKSFVPRKWYIHILTWVVLFFVCFPLYYALIVSTQTNAEMFRLSLLPGTALGENLERVLREDLVRLTLNTAFVAATSTIIKTILALMAGLAFVFFRFRGKWLVFTFVLASMMLPDEVSILALFRLVAIDLSWGNTYAALIFPFVASAAAIFLFRQHFASLPPELSEAAQLDGANPIQFLFAILIPLSWNAVGALAVIMFMGTWNSYLWPLMIISNEENQVIQVGLGSLRAASEMGQVYGPLMLGAVIASIPPVTIFLVFQKQFLSGLAIK